MQADSPKPSLKPTKFESKSRPFRPKPEQAWPTTIRIDCIRRHCWSHADRVAGLGPRSTASPGSMRPRRLDNPKVEGRAELATEKVAVKRQRCAAAVASSRVFHRRFRGPRKYLVHSSVGQNRLRRLGFDQFGPNSADVVGSLRIRPNVGQSSADFGQCRPADVGQVGPQAFRGVTFRGLWSHSERLSRDIKAARICSSQGFRAVAIGVSRPRPGVALAQTQMRRIRCTPSLPQRCVALDAAPK